MNEKTKKDLIENKIENYINDEVDKIINNDPRLIQDFKELELEYNIDGTKKDIYTLASEIDIKKMQVKSDKNELEFKLNQKQITKEDFDKKLRKIDESITMESLIYDELIFNLIDKKDIEIIKKSIKEKNLNDIDLKRLSSAIRSVTDNKINEFQKNNEEFKIENFSYWNYKYDKIAKSISKAREVENFILSLIE